MTCGPNPPVACLLGNSQYTLTYVLSKAAFVLLFYFAFIYLSLAVLGLRCCVGFALVAGATNCGVWAFHRSGFSNHGARTLETSGFSSCGSRAPESRLNSCGTWA